MKKLCQLSSWLSLTRALTQVCWSWWWRASPSYDSLWGYLNYGALSQPSWIEMGKCFPDLAGSASSDLWFLFNEAHIDYVWLSIKSCATRVYVLMWMSAWKMQYKIRNQQDSLSAHRWWQGSRRWYYTSVTWSKRNTYNTSRRICRADLSRHCQQITRWK